MYKNHNKSWIFGTNIQIQNFVIFSENWHSFLLYNATFWKLRILECLSNYVFPLKLFVMNSWNFFPMMIAISKVLFPDLLLISSVWLGWAQSGHHLMTIWKSTLQIEGHPLQRSHNST